MASKWNNKQCPVCMEGTLRDEKQKQRCWIVILTCFRN